MSRKRLGEDVTEGSEDVPGRFVVNPIVARAWHPAGSAGAGACGWDERLWSSDAPPASWCCFASDWKGQHPKVLWQAIRAGCMRHLIVHGQTTAGQGTTLRGSEFYRSSDIRTVAESVRSSVYERSGPCFADDDDDLQGNTGRASEGR